MDAYLLGQYLGDGHLARHRRNVFRLRITTCDEYPDIRAECEAAVRAVMPGKQVGRLPKAGCTDVSCYSKHWPCLFPQHGKGMKHGRPIMLLRWQERIAYDLHPELLIRGLIHSDGCRCINRVTSRTESGPNTYEYPRYFFTNVSGHIRGIFLGACRRLGIDYHYNQPTSISIARRESVALLDSFVGPKS
ncbi:MAG: hypothetical protein H0V95_13235 [Actinobacteria bacterium]|nr:hypothetical protein [Actinomycetota bacterium]